MLAQLDILAPIVQYGFLGFSAVLLGVVIWLIQRLLGMLKAVNRIIAANTQAIRELTRMTSDLLRLDRAIHDKLLSRPCLVEKKEEA